MRTRINARRGFTLVEVIVVLVVLAIVAAISIPSMTGWIDKAKEKRLVVECRTCVDAAQTLAGDAFVMTGKREAPLPGHVKKLAGVDGTVTDVTLFDKSVNVKSLTYEKDGDSITYTADENRKVLYNFTAGTGKQTAAPVPKKPEIDVNAVPKTALAEIATQFSSLRTGSKPFSGNQIDGISATTEGTRAYAIYSAMTAEQKAFLDKVSWTIKKSERLAGLDKGNNSTDGGYRLYFTTEHYDASQSAKNVTVWKYNLSTGLVQSTKNGSVTNGKVSDGGTFPDSWTTLADADIQW